MPGTVAGFGCPKAKKGSVWLPGARRDLVEEAEVGISHYKSGERVGKGQAIMPVGVEGPNKAVSGGRGGRLP